jgi:hypothetical protein
MWKSSEAGPEALTKSDCPPHAVPALDSEELRQGPGLQRSKFRVSFKNQGAGAKWLWRDAQAPERHPRARKPPAPSVKRRLGRPPLDERSGTKPAPSVVEPGRRPKPVPVRHLSPLTSMTNPQSSASAARHAREPFLSGGHRCACRLMVQHSADALGQAPTGGDSACRSAPARHFMRAWASVSA